MNKTITNDKLNHFMHELYNKWFRKYRDKSKTMPEEDWNACVDELVEIIESAEESRLVKTIGNALLYELDARRKGGYE